jgi:hypothetical protein
MPEPYRGLLVNDGDMTPTLERFHGCKLRLRVLASAREGDIYRRQVALIDILDRPVEYGAIRIHLDTLPPLVQAQVLAGRRPLGGLLIDNRVQHHSRPSAFFAVDGEGAIAEALALTAPAELYGRCNTLVDGDGRAIAEVVEILPPVQPVQKENRA